MFLIFKFRLNRRTLILEDISPGTVAWLKWSSDKGALASAACPATTGGSSALDAKGAAQNPKLGCVKSMAGLAVSGVAGLSGLPGLSVGKLAGLTLSRSSFSDVAGRSSRWLFSPVRLPCKPATKRNRVEKKKRLRRSWLF